MRKNHSDTAPSDPRIFQVSEAMAIAGHNAAVEQKVEIVTITIVVKSLDEQGEPVLSINSTGYDTPGEMIQGTMSNLIESAISIGILPALEMLIEPPEGGPLGGFSI